MPSANRQLNPATAILWACAFLLVALIIIQAGKLPANTAHADQANWRGDITLLTTSAGTGGSDAPYELLYVIDNRDEVLLVYEMEDVQQRRIHLRDGGALPNLFRAAR